MKDISAMGMTQEASVISNKDDSHKVGVVDYFLVECFDIDGNLKWKETIKNLVTDQGLEYVLNSGFKGGTAYSSWFVGLKAAGTPADTDAASALPTVGNWTEYTTYYIDSPGEAEARPALTLGTVTSAVAGTATVDNSASKASFTIESPANDVDGVFIVDSASKNSNSGANVLYGVGQFTGGAKTGLSAGDTLNVTVTLEASTA